MRSPYHVVTDANGQFSTASELGYPTRSEYQRRKDPVRTVSGSVLPTPDDSKGALLYDTYAIEELQLRFQQAGLTLIPAFDVVVVSRNKVSRGFRDAYR